MCKIVLLEIAHWFSPPNESLPLSPETGRDDTSASLSTHHFLSPKFGSIILPVQFQSVPWLKFESGWVVGVDMGYAYKLHMYERARGGCALAAMPLIAVHVCETDSMVFHTQAAKSWISIHKPFPSHLSVQWQWWWWWWRQVQIHAQSMYLANVGTGVATGGLSNEVNTIKRMNQPCGFFILQHRL